MRDFRNPNQPGFGLIWRAHFPLSSQTARGKKLARALSVATCRQDAGATKRLVLLLQNGVV
jgi:hypothetical protein